MITAAMREAAYQALVTRGVPIPPNEIDAVLEAAEGARGEPMDARAEIKRLRGQNAELVRAASRLVRWLGPWSDEYQPTDPQMHDLAVLRLAISTNSTLPHPGKQTA